jgi:hypothetical protein
MFTTDTYFGGKFAERLDKHGQIGAKGDITDKEVPRGSLGITSRPNVPYLCLKGQNMVKAQHNCLMDLRNTADHKIRAHRRLPSRSSDQYIYRLSAA